MQFRMTRKTGSVNSSRDNKHTVFHCSEKSTIEDLATKSFKRGWQTFLGEKKISKIHQVTGKL